MRLICKLTSIFILLMAMTTGHIGSAQNRTPQRGDRQLRPQLIDRTRIQEVDVAHLGGLPGKRPATRIVTAAGTGAAAKLSSWTLNSQTNMPVHLKNSEAFSGSRVKLHVLTPLGALSRPTPRAFISGIIRNGDLCLTTWRLADDGSFTMLQTVGYGSNAQVTIKEYDISHRALPISPLASEEKHLIVTPVITNNNRIRLITWRVNVNTGAITGLQDGGDYGDPSVGSRVSITPQIIHLNNSGISAIDARLFTVTHRNAAGGNLASSFWLVTDNGKIEQSGGGSTGYDITGKISGQAPVKESAVAPLDGGGYVTALRENDDSMKLAVWDIPILKTDGEKDLFEPAYISDSLVDKLPLTPGVQIDKPTISGGRARLLDESAAEKFGVAAATLFDKMPGGSNIAGGIASTTKIMTLLLTLEALNDGKIDLGTVVTINSQMAETSQAWMSPPLEEGDQVQLQTLIHGMMKRSANGATYAVAHHVASKLFPGNFTVDELIAKFVERMNQRAAELGMTNTIYCGVRGSCHSTPEDQMKLWLKISQGDATRKKFWEFTGVGHYSTDCGKNKEGVDKCFDGMSKSDLQFIGVQGWKDGNHASNLGVGYKDGKLQCNLPPTAVDACRSCLTSETKRLNRPMIIVVQQSDSDGDDTRSLLTYGYRRLFTPDLRSGQAVIGVDKIKDFAIDNVTDTLALDATVYGSDVLRLRVWKVDATANQIQQLGDSQITFNDLPASSSNIQSAWVEIVRLSIEKAAGDYLTAHVNSGGIQLRVWRVGPKQP